MASIVFVGLGNMGDPMAANLVRIGHRVAGFDLGTRPRDVARLAGVAPFAEAGHATLNCSAIVTAVRGAG